MDIGNRRMINLHIIIANKIATYQQRDGSIVCGNNDYQIKFTFDDEWSAYENKIARFIWGGQFQDVEFTGDTCPVPILSGVTLCEVGVYAGELCTTTSAFISCKPSILCQPANPSVENDKYWANEAHKYAEEAKKARDSVDSPYIKDGNWWVGEIDTGVKATGDDYVITDTDYEEIAQLVFDTKMEQAEDLTYGR
jgi:hypothetical protein